MARHSSSSSSSQSDSPPLTSSERRRRRWRTCWRRRWRRPRRPRRRCGCSGAAPAWWTRTAWGWRWATSPCRSPSVSPAGPSASPSPSSGSSPPSSSSSSSSSPLLLLSTFVTENKRLCGLEWKVSQAEIVEQQVQPRGNTWLSESEEGGGWSLCSGQYCHFSSLQLNTFLTAPNSASCASEI